MNDGNGNARLARALELSREMLSVAERGDASVMASLDAERLRLLDLERPNSRNMNATERLVLQKIGELNDQAIGLLEHRRRRIEREMDTVTVGRRAVLAYSAAGLQR
ncbi:MAG: hypothetical protein JWN43_3838 [Gammaproteobacteria bacterium]|nr:hypothetical protein [Gammaproteobacteria bacterium]